MLPSRQESGQVQIFGIYFWFFIRERLPEPGVYEVSMTGAIKVKFTGKDHEGSFSVTCLAPEQE